MPLSQASSTPHNRKGGYLRVGFKKFVAEGVRLLEERDPELHGLIDRELASQSDTLMMVAASSAASPAVAVCEGGPLLNVTAEGYPGARFHAGSAVADQIENLAVSRAMEAFDAQHANVQPHSGSSANLAVLFALMSPGDTLLGFDLDSGGHLTHGSAASVTGRYFNPVSYGLGADGLIDYEQVRELARRHRPKVIICGASAYPRTIDFALFREIADSVGAYLVADISHISGLVVAGLHPSPVDLAHVTTTSTYKQLYGPRGGLILLGRDHQGRVNGGAPLTRVIDRAVFPLTQGTPNIAAIAAKAQAFHYVASPSFVRLATLVKEDAAEMARALADQGHTIVSGGTDNHMVLVDVLSSGRTGVVTERGLEECRMVVNRNRIHGDTKPPRVASGIRIGTNSLALRGIGPTEIREIAGLFQTAFEAIEPRSDTEHVIDKDVAEGVRSSVVKICQRFPLPDY